MSTYQTIREQIEQYPFVDAHSHVLHHNIEAPIVDGPYEVHPTAQLLLDFNTRLSFITCGLPEKTVDDILTGKVELAEQKRLLLSFPGVRSKTSYTYLMRGIRELYGLDVWYIDEYNWDAVGTAVSKARKDFYGLLENAFTNGGVKNSILNLWAGKGRLYLKDYSDALTRQELDLDRKFFLFSSTFDYRAMLPFGPVIQAYAEDFGMPLDTLADYEAVLEKTACWFVKEKDCRALKVTEMYFRRLDYRVRSYEEAASCYLPERTEEQSRILSDYVACIVFRLAGELNVPVQIHTGNIWGDFSVYDVDPSHLAPIIQAFPNTKFDLLHGGDPFYGHTTLMVSAFPNAYLNMSSMPDSSYDLFEEWLAKYIDRVPSTKILLGWDVFTPEIVSGCAHFTRDVLARVLAKKVDMGLYSLDLALEIAKDLMYRTAETLFGTAN